MTLRLNKLNLQKYTAVWYKLVQELSPEKLQEYVKSLIDTPTALTTEEKLNSAPLSLVAFLAAGRADILPETLQLLWDNRDKIQLHAATLERISQHPNIPGNITIDLAELERARKEKSNKTEEQIRAEEAAREERYERIREEADKKYRLNAPERLPLPGETFDLPGNLPEGFANKLNLMKKSKLNLRKAEILDQFGNPVVSPKNISEIDKKPKEYVTDVAPGPMGEWPIYQQPSKGWDRFWEWLGNVAEAFPTKTSKLNLRKTAGWYLTPKGEELAETVKGRDVPLDTPILNLNAEDSAALSLFINMIRIEPGTTLESAIEGLERTRAYKTFESSKEGLEENLEEKKELDISKMARDGAQLAIAFGLVELKDPPLNIYQETFDLPENMPESKPPTEWDWQMFHPASKLNLRKARIVDNELQQDFSSDILEAKSHVADTLWSLLNVQHDLQISTADGYYTYEIAPGHVAFNMDNDEILNLFHTAYFEWLNYYAPDSIKTDSNAQAIIYENISKAFREGYS